MRLRAALLRPVNSASSQWRLFLMNSRDIRAFRPHDPGHFNYRPHWEVVKRGGGETIMEAAEPVRCPLCHIQIPDELSGPGGDTFVLDLQREQHHHGQQYADLYDGVQAFKNRYGLHDVSVQPRDCLALRRDSEREQVQELIKRFRDIPDDHQKRLPALLNSLAQLELLIGEFDAAQQDFDEVACLVANHDERAEAHHNTYRAALERRDWPEALAALLRACTLAPDLYEPFPLDRFEPKTILGAGALGVTFLCTERGTGETVVIKSLREDTLERPAEQILNELQWLQDLEQPALARPRETGFADGNQSRPYLILDNFEGQTLAEHIRRNGPLEPADALAVLWPIARALQAMHLRGVLHRGLSPWSVLIRPVEERETPPGEEELPEEFDEEEEQWVPEEDSIEDGFGGEDADVPGGDAEDEGEDGEDDKDDGESFMRKPPSPRWYPRLIETGLSLKRTVLHAAASSPAARAQTGLGRSVVRSLPYAPSEITGRPKGLVWVGPHSDVFSFGKLCCFVLTGSPELPAAAAQPAPEEDSPRDFKEAWLQLCREWAAWTTAGRPQHVGTILQRLMGLPDASEIVDSAERFGTQLLLDDYTSRLRRNPDDVRCLAGRAALHFQAFHFDACIADYGEALKRRPHDAHLLRRRGQVLLNTFAPEAALADLNHAIELEPRNLEGWNLRANAHSRKGDHDAAIADYTEVIRQSPRDEDGYFNRGNEYLSKGEWQQAIDDYTAAIRIDPTHPWAYGNRGKARAHLGQHEQAIADFSQLLRLDPGNTRACMDRGASLLSLGRYEEAIEEFTRGIESDPSAGLYIERGLARADHGDHEQAIEDFTRAIELNPKGPWPLIYRGNSRASRGEMDEALADLSEAIRLGPELAAGWYHRGGVYLRTGELELAIADFTRTIELDPSHLGAHFSRGNARNDRGELEQAIADYTKVIDSDPSDVAALNNRGNAYAGHGDLDAALADFDAALALEPEDAITLFNRGNTHSRLGEMDQAIADYTEVVRLQPAHARAYNNRGNAHGEQGEVSKALDDYTRAIECDPMYPRAYNNRGDLLAEEGRLDEALADLSKALELDPAYVAAWRNRAHAHMQHGDFDAALSDLTKALELAPGDVPLLLDRAGAHQRKCDLDAALADLTRAIETDPAQARPWLVRGNLHNDRGNLDAALADYTKAIEASPRLLLAYHNRGRVFAKRGDYLAAIGDNLAALAIDPDNPNTLNNLAWLWATCPVDALRDGAKAVEHAAKACAKTDFSLAGYLDTLAVAHAACGQFEEAVKWQEKALELCAEEEKADCRSRLELYRAGRPYREA